MELMLKGLDKWKETLEKITEKVCLVCVKEIKNGIDGGCLCA